MMDDNAETQQLYRGPDHYDPARARDAKFKPPRSPERTQFVFYDHAYDGTDLRSILSLKINV